MLTSEAIAEYAGSISIDDFPREVLESSSRVLIDSLGCCLGAYSSPPVTGLRSLYGDHRSAGFEATVIGTTDRIPAEYAALVNGTMIRYLDFNDGFRGPHGGCHPSDQIPALLAVAEAEGASGAELVEAMTLAYEVQCTGVATGAIRRRGWDYVTWGTHGATAAVGKLMGLTMEELVDALGMAVAANNALEITRLGSVSMWKGVAQAFGCHNAIHACQMARAGLTGPAAVYEGKHGFIEVVAGSDVQFDLGEGGAFKITRSNIKPYAACYLALTAVDAVLETVERHDLDPEDIEGIAVETFDQAYRTTGTPEKWSSEMTRETADHSLPYILAIAVLEGRIMPEHYRPTWLRNERVHQFMDKVSVSVDPEIDAYIREHPTSVPSTVTMKTAQGSFEVRHEYPSGHAEKPMSDAAIEGKMAGLASDTLSDDRIRSTIDRCHRLSELDRAAEVLRDVVV